MTLPRDLGDVADYFLPRAQSATSAPRFKPQRPESEPDRIGSDSSTNRVGMGPDRPAALPILAVPVGDRDVVRAAFTWNLVVEVARLGGCAALVAPNSDSASPLWPEAGKGPVGAEVYTVPAANLSELHLAAIDVAVTRAADCAETGIVLVRTPPAWLEGLTAEAEGRNLLRWTLLFASTEREDLLEAYALAKRIVGICHDAQVGVTIHGARRVAEAERAFHHVASVSLRHLNRTLLSYGLLVDDLHIYRAIVSRRAIGIEHPQSRAARALRDVAQLVLDDARKLAIA